MRRNFIPIACVSLAIVVAAILYNRTRVRRHSIPPLAPLTTLVSEIGDWIQVTPDGQINAEMEEALQITYYLFRDCINVKTSKISKSDLLTIIHDNNLTPREHQRKLKQATDDPGAFISFAITYYTGTTTNIAHIPERGYFAESYLPREESSVSWPTPDGPFKVHYITYENPREEPKARVCHVAHFFVVNGQFTDNSDFVHQTAQNSAQGCSYYAKIELRSGNPDRTEAETQMKDFLKLAFPEIKKLLPSDRSRSR